MTEEEQPNGGGQQHILPGLWLLARDKEMFLPYAQFPWFKDVPISAILKVEEPRRGHFYWPGLDVDLIEEIIEHPERFPLSAKLKQTR